MLERGGLQPPRLVPAEFITNCVTGGAPVDDPRLGTPRPADDQNIRPRAASADSNRRRDARTSFHQPRHARSSAHWQVRNSIRSSSAVPLWKDLASLDSAPPHAPPGDAELIAVGSGHAGPGAGEVPIAPRPVAAGASRSATPTRRARLAEMPETRTRPRQSAPVAPLRRCRPSRRD